MKKHHFNGFISLMALFGLALSPYLLAKDFDLNEAPVGVYQLDKTHAYVTFTYLHQGYSKPWLRFRLMDSTLTLADDPEDSQLTVSIDPASIDSGVDIFDEHLRGDKHFDVAQYPNIRFVATDIAIDGNQVAITGDLSMKDKVGAITLKGQFNRGGLHFRSKQPTLGFSATTTLKRSEWSLGYAVPFVGDEVEIVIEVEYNLAAE